MDEISSNNDVLILGSKQRLDRATYPSAHNYYLDLIYNFGIISIFPILWLFMYTLKYIFIIRWEILLSIPVIGITLSTLFLIQIANNFKVGLRHPHPGKYSFFLCGVLLSILLVMQKNKAQEYSVSQGFS